jgi:hypothetical protein
VLIRTLVDCQFDEIRILFSLFLDINEFDDVVIGQLFEHLVIFNLLTCFKVVLVRLVENINIHDAIAKKLFGFLVDIGRVQDICKLVLDVDYTQVLIFNLCDTD